MVATACQTFNASTVGGDVVCAHDGGAAWCTAASAAATTGGQPITYRYGR
jgi:hypothetical protein